MKKTTTYLFGQVALKKRFITPKQLAEALAQQITLSKQGSPLHIGQIMLKM